MTRVKFMFAALAAAAIISVPSASFAQESCGSGCTAHYVGAGSSAQFLMSAVAQDQAALDANSALYGNANTVKHFTLKNGAYISDSRNADITNEVGSFDADFAGRALIFNTGNTITNADTFEATNGGKLTIENGTVLDNVGNNANLEAGAGSQVEIVSAAVTGGVIQAVGANAAVQLANATITGAALSTGSATSSSDGVIEIAATGGTNLSVLASTSVAGSAAVSVPAPTPWYDSGIAVVAGEEITITASGLVSFGEPNADNPPTGIPGQTAGPGDVAPGLPNESLVGEIGSGTPFEIGDGTSFIATSSGELKLSIDDDFFGDNFGSWSTSITVAEINSGFVQVDAAANLGLQGLIENNGTIDIIHGGAVLVSGDSAEVTGSGTIINDGTLQATSGELAVINTVNGSGAVDAAGGFIDFFLGISGGTAAISGGGKIEYGWSSNVATTFDGYGALVLDHQNQSDTNYANAHFSGAVHNFGSGDTIDLTDLTHSADETVSWDPLTSTLTVDSNDQTAKITLAGTYSQDDFALSHDSGTGIEVVWVDTIADGVTYELTTPAADKVVFATGDGTLILDDPAHFAGVISGINGSGDVLDLKGFNAHQGDGFQVEADHTGSVTDLTVTDTNNHTSEMVTLAGDYSAGADVSWDASYDGNGGIDVHDPPISDANGSGSTGFLPNEEQITFGPNGEVTYTIESGTTVNTTTQTQTTSITNGNVVGQGANDTFVFQPGMGSETIANFNPQHDTLSFEHFAQAQTVQELQSLITTDAHGDAMINLGHNDSVTLAGVTTAQLQQAIQSSHVLLH